MSIRTPLTVVGDGDLRAFRAGLTGPAALAQLAAARGRLLVRLPVGVGQTGWMERIVEHAIRPPPAFDCVLVLPPPSALIL